MFTDLYSENSKWRDRKSWQFIEEIRMIVVKAMGKETGQDQTNVFHRALRVSYSF